MTDMNEPLNTPSRESNPYTQAPNLYAQAPNLYAQAPNPYAGQYKDPETLRREQEALRIEQERERQAMIAGRRVERAELFGKLIVPVTIFAIFNTVFCYENYANLGFMITSIVMVVIACAGMKAIGLELKKGTFLYGGAVILLGISGFLTDNVVIQTFNYIGSVLLLWSMFLYTRFDTRQWTFAKFMGGLGVMIGGQCGKVPSPFQDLGAYCTLRKLEKESAKNANGATVQTETGAQGDIPQTKAVAKMQFGKVLLGIAISIPILAIVGTLLYHADIVFANVIDQMFAGVSFGTIFGMFNLFFFSFLFAYAAIRYTGASRYREEASDHRKLDPTVAITILAVVSVLYLAFSGIQIVFLFARQMELPADVTYAQYVHQGFYQLLAVCVINLVLVLLVRGLFRKNKATNVLMTVITICTYVMLASCLFRLLMYVDAYNMTRLRLFVFWGVGVLAILFVGVLILIYNEKFPLFHYATVVITICYLALSLGHSDYWIAKYNLTHADYTGSYDEQYLVEKLSLDAAPAYVETNHPEVLAKVHYNRADRDNFRTVNVSRLIARQLAKDVLDN